MATIEPRLIHLLNDFTTPQPSSISLPPLQSCWLADRPPPVQPLAGDSLAGQTAFDAASHLRRTTGSDGFGTCDTFYPADYGSSIVAAAPRPLRLLLEDTDFADWPGSLSKILDDDPLHAGNVTLRKRDRALNLKEDVVQLPQPVKKQKAAQQPPPSVPPIINGLYEPPPNAAVFPPISSGAFQESDIGQLLFRDPFNIQLLDRLEQPVTNPAPALDRHRREGKSRRKRASKPRRKWTDQETTSLLLGVNRHGVGKWTCILEDPDFGFNERNAGDLKDRFRTCCPDQLRLTHAKSETPYSPRTPVAELKPSTRTGVLSEIMICPPDTPPPPPPPPPPSFPLPSRPLLLFPPKEPASAGTAASLDLDAGHKLKKSRAHRKNSKDLAEIGIHAPFKKSHRRERRHFTEQEDREILCGLEEYGPAWTKIQRDSRYHLGSRQPTDLRDRVRNKYPHLYTRIEKGAFHFQDGGRTNLLEPSVDMAIESSLLTTKSALVEPHTAAPRDDLSRHDLSRLPYAHSLLDDDTAPLATLEFAGTHATPFMGSVGEMDISRLLLHDTEMARSTHSHQNLSGPHGWYHTDGYHSG